jgi:hypothetical protein
VLAPHRWLSVQTSTMRIQNRYDRRLYGRRSANRGTLQVADFREQRGIDISMVTITDKKSVSPFVAGTFRRLPDVR